MALLAINVDFPFKEIVQSIDSETGLRTRVFYYKIELDFVLNENDRLFSDISDNCIIKICPWVLSDNLV